MSKNTASYIKIKKGEKKHTHTQRAATNVLMGEITSSRLFLLFFLGQSFAQRIAQDLSVHVLRLLSRLMRFSPLMRGCAAILVQNRDNQSVGG